MAARKRSSRAKPRPITDRELGRTTRSLVRASGADPLAAPASPLPSTMTATAEAGAITSAAAPAARIIGDPVGRIPLGADGIEMAFGRRNPFGIMRETVDVFGADQFASILNTVRTIRISGAIAEVKDATGGKLQVIAVRRDNA